MSLINDLSNGAKACVDVIMNKADDTIELSRLGLAQSALSEDISKSLKLLGAKVYKSKATGEEINIDDDIKKIGDMYEQLKNIRARIAEVKGVSADSCSDEKEDSED